MTLYAGMRWVSALVLNGWTKMAFACSWNANMMYWLPLIALMGKRPMSSVKSLEVANTLMCTDCTGSVSSLNSSVDGSNAFFILSKAHAAAAHRVLRRPCGT